MSLSITNCNNGIKYITVVGELCDEMQKKSFFYTLDERDTMEIQVTFLDASIVEGEIIEKLAAAQSRKKLKVFVVKPYLYSYMYKLGIRCNYVPRKDIYSVIDSEKLGSTQIQLDKEEVLNFLYDIDKKYGYDYTEYQMDSIIRRIKISMLRTSSSDFDEFKNLVLENERYFEQLFLDFSINTTEFFRDPGVFQTIKDKIFTYLNSYSYIRVWCVGCSSGKEPYSLAILLYEAGLLHKTQIYATDINPYVIEEAKNGMYPIEDIEEGIINYRMAGGANNFISYFQLKENYIKIEEELKRNILFFQHSILSKGIINEFQLILCRNVLIYFNSQLQKKVVKYLSRSLDRSGFLVLGKSAGMLLNDGFNYFSEYNVINKIYRNKIKF